MNQTVDYGRKPGMMPAPTKTAPLTGEPAGTLTVERGNWKATYKLAYCRKNEAVYDLDSVEVKDD